MSSSLSQVVLCIILWGLGKIQETKRKTELHASVPREKTQIQETETIVEDEEKQPEVVKEPKKYRIIVVP